MSSYYGVIFPEFWTGRTGRELRERGKDAQLLGLYLATNRHANMIGLYRLLIEDVRHETGLGVKAIERGFGATAAANFAQYDAASSFVWVLNMARFRLGLKAGVSLDRKDLKVLAVNRIYHALEGNPFLGEFFDMNHRMLHIQKRREPVGLVVPSTEDHKGSPLGRGFEGATKPDPDTENRIRNRDQVQKKAAAPPPDRPRDNVGVLTRLAHDVVKAADLTDGFADLKADLKSRAAKLHILYDADVAGAALESALAQRKAAVS